MTPIERLSDAPGLSRLMEVALHELVRVTDPDGEFGVGADMSVWGGVEDQGMAVKEISFGFDSKVCTVCMAGAVMLGSGLRPESPGVLLHASEISGDECEALMAVDHARRGELREGYRSLGRNWHEKGALNTRALEEASYRANSPQNLFRLDRALGRASVMRTAHYWMTQIIPVLGGAEKGGE